MTLVFLDTETTGLELHHDIWEIAWSYDDGDHIYSEILVHSLKNADPDALVLNGYWNRPHRARGPEVDIEVRVALEDVTIVGANPAFDATRLQLRWQAQPWHYRLLDISSMAVGIFGLREDGRPPGLADVAKACRDVGAVIPEPDHTAAGDVATLKACYNVLTTLRDFPQRYIA